MDWIGLGEFVHSNEIRGSDCEIEQTNEPNEWACEMNEWVSECWMFRKRSLGGLFFLFLQSTFSPITQYAIYQRSG